MLDRQRGHASSREGGHVEAELQHGPDHLAPLSIGSRHPDVGAARIQEIDVTTVPGLPGRGDVVVHGDFGPQNALVDGSQLSALLDWEFAHLGRPVEDLAWAEWIVRMHHPDHRGELPELFAAAQLEPGWTDRHAVMVDRCTDLMLRAEGADQGDDAALWRMRLVTTESWSE